MCLFSTDLKFCRLVKGKVENSTAGKISTFYLRTNRLNNVLHHFQYYFSCTMMTANTFMNFSASPVLGRNSKLAGSRTLP